MLELYECDKCKQMVLIVQEGPGSLVCCDQPMIQMQEKSGAEEGKEKHIPVVEKTEKGTRVKVGSIPHPMVDDHFIQWIEVIGDSFLQTETLKPGENPEKEFCVPFEKVKKVRIFCNKHGFWIKK
ncbi:MAG: desulfoferrodoxin [Methanomicrobiales archaeon]|nr:desulfoferrodoxin [Methanomicrobiales archaeon]